MKCTYDKAEEILNIQLRDTGKSIELPNGIVIDVDKAGSAMGLEILRACKIFCDDVKNVIETTKTV